MAIEITIDDAELQRRLRGLLEALGEARFQQALDSAGEILIERTKQNIEAGHDWQGDPFAKNQPSTLARKRGRAPLIDSGAFVSSRLSHHAAGRTLELRASGVQAAVLHFGAQQGQFGKTRRGAPIPWGDIPPRPICR